MAKKNSIEAYNALITKYNNVHEQVIVLRRLLKEQRELLIDLGKERAEYELRQNDLYFKQKKCKMPARYPTDTYEF